MSSKAAFDRLRKEYARLSKAPVDHIEAAPLDTNILEWHYVLTGPKGTPYGQYHESNMATADTQNGIYHGKIIFPPQYPFKGPSILMSTPSGRFKTDTRLCLSMSDFHPESWNPLWSVSSILSGLLSFMLEATPTQGSIESSDHTKREFAVRSLQHNLKNATFKKLFPHYIQIAAAQQAASNPAASVEAAASSNLSTVPSTPAGAAPSDASLKQRRPIGAVGDTVAAVPAADGAAAAVDAPVINLFGGRICVPESQFYDVMVLLIIICTVIFAALYVQRAQD